MAELGSGKVRKMRTELAHRFGEQVRVDFCMRYGNPSTKAKVREMERNDETTQVRFCFATTNVTPPHQATLLCGRSW